MLPEDVSARHVEGTVAEADKHYLDESVCVSVSSLCVAECMLGMLCCLICPPLPVSGDLEFSVSPEL